MLLMVRAEKGEEGRCEGYYAGWGVDCLGGENE